MSDADTQEYDPLLMQLVLSLQTAAMVEMGKLMNPQTGKTERRLPMAKNSIDMLGMLKDKTEGNLSPAEKQHLEHVLYELRMNFVDESERPDEPDGKTPESDGAGAKSDTEPAGETDSTEDSKTSTE